LRLRLGLLFAAIALLYAGPALLPGRALLPLDLPRDMLAWKRDPSIRGRVSNSLMSDPIVQFSVWDAEVRRMLAKGEMPWVNRYAGEGGPLFANPQTALFSPFTWPRLLFGLYGWALAAMLKLVTAAVCARWLAREMGAEPRAAIISAIVYACSGQMIVWLLYPHTNVLSVLPGLLAASLRLIRQPNEKHALFVILFAALITAGGHPEMLMTGVLGVIVFLIAHCERTHKWGLLGTIPALTGAMFGFLLLAVVNVPFAILAYQSDTAAMRAQMIHPFRYWTVISQIVPGILGSPLQSELDLTALPHAEPFTIRAGAYIGAIALFAVILCWRSLSDPLRRGLKIGIIGLILSWCIPGVERLFHLAPLLSQLALEYCATPFVLFASIASGPALCELASRPRKKAGALLILGGCLLLVAGVLPSLPPLRPQLVAAAHQVIDLLRARGHLQQSAAVYEQRLTFYLAAAGWTALRRIALPGLLWLIAGVALLRGKRSAVIAAALAELVAFGIGYNPAVSLQQAAPMPPAIAQIRQMDPRHEWLIASNFEVFPANLGTNYAVRDVVSLDVLMSKSYTAQLREAGYDSLLHTIPKQLSPEALKALGRLGVRFVINPDGSVSEIPNAALHPMPVNARPEGLELGALVSLLAFVISIGWLRLYRSTFDTIPNWSDVRS